MKIAVFATAVCLLIPSVTAAQAARPPTPQPPATAPAQVAQAYEQFLLGHPTVMLRMLQAEARRLRIANTWRG